MFSAELAKLAGPFLIAFGRVVTPGTIGKIASIESLLYKDSTPLPTFPATTITGASGAIFFLSPLPHHKEFYQI